MMRLITHNLLACNAKDCKSGYPLKIEEGATIVKENMEIHRDFVEKLLPRLNYDVLYSTAQELGVKIPKTYNTSKELNDDLIHIIGNAFLNISVKEGRMKCPSCGHVYEIKNGIANMLH